MFLISRFGGIRVVGVAMLACLLFAWAGCSGSPNPVAPGALSGNWQINMSENYPNLNTQLTVSGFLTQSADTLGGSLQGPTLLSSNGQHDCGGVGQVSGALNGTAVTFSVSPGGTTFSFSGTITGPNTMAGSFQALAGDCFIHDSSGTWTASLIPTVSGNFTGTLTNSNYMTLLTGVSPAAPINVSGSLTQSSNAGSSVASLSGTINAVGYPCFSTATLTGTISGQNVILAVYGFDGTQIGTLGVTSVPAQASSGSTGTALTGTGQGGLLLGKVTATSTVGPCPPLNGGAGNTIGDSTDISLTF